jgi:hypothetical protein
MKLKERLENHIVWVVVASIMATFSITYGVVYRIIDTKYESKYVMDEADRIKQIDNENISKLKDKIAELNIELENCSPKKYQTSISDKDKEIAALKIEIVDLSNKLKDVNYRLNRDYINSDTIISKYGKEDHVYSIRIILKEPNEMPKENASEFLSMKGAVDVDGIANIGLHLKNERLILIPVIEGGDFQTYDIIHVEKNGNFSSSWPIKSLKSLKGRTFWIGLFKENGEIKPRGRYSYSPIKFAKFTSNYIHFN